MCIKAAWVDPSFLRLVPDQYKTQEICERVVEDDSSSLQYLPDWFATQQQINYGVITMTIAMMISLLHGTMVIKNERLKKLQ